MIKPQKRLGIGVKLFLQAFPSWISSSLLCDISCSQQVTFCAIDHDSQGSTLTNTLSHSCSLGKCLLTTTLSSSCRVPTTAGSGFLKLNQALFTPSDPILALGSACCSRSSGIVSIAYADKPSSSSLTSVDQTSSLMMLLMVLRVVSPQP